MTAACYTLRRPGDVGAARAGWLREDVRQALAQPQFTLVYQPVVRLVDRQVVAHEALLRLNPPPWLPALPTAAFVALAAEWGLSAALDAAVLDANGGTRASVNVAARSLQDVDFLARACAGRVSLEITTASSIDDWPGFAQAVAALRAAGACVCLDNLGADDAALECMRIARFDGVKLSGAAVRAATGGERGRRLIAALVALAARMGAFTVAKSVETLPQAWLMQELGVAHGQGWLFGPPGRRPTA